MLVDKIKLEPGEQILLQTRRHWFVLVSQILSLVTVGLVPLIAAAALNNIVTTTITSSFDITEYLSELLFIYCIILVFIWMTIFSVWTNFYIDVLTITDRRAILVDHKGFFWRNVASFRLERMQDINIETNGLFATLLDYGTIDVDTASDDEQFRATFLPKPGRIKSIILQASDNRIASTPNHSGIDLV